ncbi:MAG: 4Fe-4S cluster-binding domain-containing protein [Planctomycetes bacterium]|nr:4Fe-4S cluster-binding domain-containing protein [Planctomycetota bacterium]
MQVFEIFRSIQGETSRAGLPMWFVRLAGCDLACTYCDTPAARDPAAGREVSVADVAVAVSASALPWVAITGGEPLLQAAEVNALVAALAAQGRGVLVETSGAHPIDVLDPRAVRIVDVKTPGSGMADRMHWRNLDLVAERDEVKFVLTGREDYEWARGLVSRRRLAARTTVLFGSAAPCLEPRTLAEWILADALPVRLNFQVHKMLGLR